MKMSFFNHKKFRNSLVLLVLIELVFFILVFDEIIFKYDNLKFLPFYLNLLYISLFLGVIYFFFLTKKYGELAFAFQKMNICSGWIMMLKNILLSYCGFAMLDFILCKLFKECSEESPFSSLLLIFSTSFIGMSIVFVLSIPFNELSATHPTRIIMTINEISSFFAVFLSAVKGLLSSSLEHQSQILSSFLPSIGNCSGFPISFPDVPVRFTIFTTSILNICLLLLTLFGLLRHISQRGADDLTSQEHMIRLCRFTVGLSSCVAGFGFSMPIIEEIKAFSKRMHNSSIRNAEDVIGFVRGIQYCLMLNNMYVCMKRRYYYLLENREQEQSGKESSCPSEKKQQASNEKSPQEKNNSGKEINHKGSSSFSFNSYDQSSFMSKLMADCICYVFDSHFLALLNIVILFVFVVYRILRFEVLPIFSFTS